MQNPQLFLGKLRNEHLFYKRSTEHHSHTVPVKVIFLKYPTLNIDYKTKQLFESEIKKNHLVLRTKEQCNYCSGVGSKLNEGGGG